jgi:hypothetical protein
MKMKQYQPPKVKVLTPVIQTSPDINPETHAVTWDNNLTAEQVEALKKDMEVQTHNPRAWFLMKQCADANMSIMEAARHLKPQKIRGASEAQIRRFFAAYNRIRGVKKDFRYQR